MPMNRRLYPDNWDDIALQLKQKANWCCEECDRPCRRQGESFAEFLKRVWTPTFEARFPTHEGDTPKPQRFTLTVSHTNHDPWNPNAELRALCTPCHCRYDIDPMQMARKRFAKREYDGQLNLLETKL